MDTRKSILYLQTYNLIKRIMWNIIIPAEGGEGRDGNGNGNGSAEEEAPVVDLRMVIGLLADIETKLEIL